MDMEKIEAAARAVQLPQDSFSRSHSSRRSGGSGKSRLSLSIVNSQKNGKRIRFSESLVSALNLTESAAMLPIANEGLLMIAEELPYDSACQVSLKNSRNAKVAYHAGMVRLLTAQFGLPFGEGGRTSMTFTDIKVEHIQNGTLVALVSIDSGNKSHTEGTSSVEERA